MPGLVDHLGRPVSTTQLKREHAAPTMTGVRQVRSGHPDFGLTPQRLARLLRRAEDGDATDYLDLAEAMEEKDLHYLSVLGTRKRQVAQLEITVEPGDDSAEAERHAQEIRDFLGRDELQDELIDILDAIGKGYSVTEIMWETSEREWRPARLEWRFPQWFEFDREDGRTLKLKGETGILEDLAPWKFIVHCAKVKSGLAIRGGLARAATWAYLFKNFTIKDWVAFVEVYGQPIRVGKFHAGATEDEKEVLLRAVANIGSDAAAIVPASMQLEFIEAANKGGSSIDLYERLAQYIDAQLSKAVLGQNLTTQVQGGSLAAAQVHERVKDDIERADSKQLSATLNRSLVRPHVALNHGPQKVWPRLRIGRPEDEDVEQLVKAVETLVPMGLRVGQRQMQVKLNLDDPAEDDELLAAPIGAPTVARAAANALVRRRRPRDDTDRIVNKLENIAGAQVQNLVDAVREIVQDAADFEELQERLTQLAAEFGILEVSDLVAQGLLLAELAGRDDVIEAAGDVDDG